MSDFDAMVEKAASALASKSDYNPNDVDPKLWGTLRDAWEGVAGALLEAAGVPALLSEVEGLRLWRGWEARALKAEAEIARLQGLADHVVAACERQESPGAAMKDWIAAGWVRTTLEFQGHATREQASKAPSEAQP